MNHAVHSTWLSVLAETGFIGLGIFVSLIIILIKNIKTYFTKLQQYKNQVDPVIYVSARESTWTYRYDCI